MLGRCRPPRSLAGPLTALAAVVALLGATVPAASSAGAGPATAVRRGAVSRLAAPADWARRCVGPPASDTVVDVRDKGALGDGTTDDSGAFARGVAAVRGTGGTLLVPAGDYRIDTTSPVSLGSHMTLRLEPGAVLRALASDQENYYVVLVRDAVDVRVVGGTVVGDRTVHQGTTGEWGHAVGVISSRRVDIQGVHAREAWGDGFYIGGRGTRRVTLCRVEAAENRRQGVSITYGRDVVIRGSVFRDTHGTEPEAGIDVEPNGHEHVTDIVLWHNLVRDNAGGGISLGLPHRFVGVSSTTGVARGNRVVHNGYGAIGSLPRVGILLSSGSGTRAVHNVVRDNIGIGIAELLHDRFGDPRQHRHGDRGLQRVARRRVGHLHGGDARTRLRRQRRPRQRGLRGVELGQRHTPAQLHPLSSPAGVPPR